MRGMNSPTGTVGSGQCRTASSAGKERERTQMILNCANSQLSVNWEQFVKYMVSNNDIRYHIVIFRFFLRTTKRNKPLFIIVLKETEKVNMTSEAKSLKVCPLWRSQNNQPQKTAKKLEGFGCLSNRSPAKHLNKAPQSLILKPNMILP